MPELFPGIRKPTRSFIEQIARDPARLVTMLPGGGLAYTLLLGGGAARREAAYEGAAKHYMRLLAVRGGGRPINSPRGISREALITHMQRLERHGSLARRPMPMREKVFAMHRAVEVARRRDAVLRSGKFELARRPNLIPRKRPTNERRQSDARLRVLRVKRQSITPRTVRR